MANKKTLDDLILEVLNEQVLNEVISVPVSITDKRAFSYGPPPGQNATTIATKNAQKGIAKLTISKSPNDKITIADIREYLNNIIYGPKKETSYLQLNASLGALKNIISSIGSQSEKNRWDATLRLLAGQYRSKIPEGTNPLNYLINPYRS